jgi:hypothetical protein
MSSFFSLYRRGFVSMVTGPVLVVVGFVAGIHLLALAGIAVLGWGIYRFSSTRRASR